MINSTPKIQKNDVSGHIAPDNINNNISVLKYGCSISVPLLSEAFQ